MTRLRAFWDSSLGKKAVMAITGVIGIAYVVLHMIGNLTVFQGAEEMNAYAALLHGPLKDLLWIARGILLVAVVLHVVAAVQLTRRDYAARPVGYQARRPQVSTLAARTIRLGGVVLLLFIPFHILHFTTGTIRPADIFVPGDVYGNVIAGFRVWWVTAFYLVAMVALGFHLYHGTWASVRSIGAAVPSPRPLKRRVALVLAWVVAAGFAMVPIAVWLGWVQ